MTREVLLVHGYGDVSGGRINFALLVPELIKAGFHPHRIALPWAGAKSMEDNVDALATGIIKIQESTGVEKVHVVGHSTGAVTAIAYAKLFPRIASASLDTVISLGGPLRGTKVTRLANVLFPALYYGTRTLKQIAYESEYVMELRKLPLPDGPSFNAVAALNDSVYVNLDSALFLKGSDKHLIAHWDKEVLIDDELVAIIEGRAGHLTMVTKKYLIRAVIAMLRTESA